VTPLIRYDRLLCKAPAEVLARWTMESTDGPVEHVKVRYVIEHWFTVPTWTLNHTGINGPALGGQCSRDRANQRPDRTHLLSTANPCATCNVLQPLPPPGPRV
jgi:hypothetical protein